MADDHPEEIGSDAYGDYDRHKKLVHFGYSFGGFVLTAVIDYLFLWPENHLAALLAIAAWLSVTAIVELTVWGYRPWITVSSVLGLFVGASIIDLIVGPVLPTETDIHGWLEPSNEPVPPNAACSPDTLERVRPYGMAFLLGRAGCWEPSGLGPRPVLTVSSCAAMSVEMANDKIALNADIYDGADLVAHIENNEFNLVPGKFAYQKRPDRSHLTIFDKSNKKLMAISYLNKKIVQITGVFSCSDGVKVTVTDDGDAIATVPGKPDFTFNRLCLIGTGGFVITKDGWTIGMPPPGALIRNLDGTISRVPADGQLFGLPPLRKP
jgi:hypothetical protein